MSFDLINTLPNREIETHACVASAALIDSGGTYLGAQMIDTAIREVTAPQGAPGTTSPDPGQDPFRDPGRRTCSYAG